MKESMQYNTLSTTGKRIDKVTAQQVRKLINLLYNN